MKRIGYVILMLILLADIVSAIGVVYARHESRRLFVQLTKLNNERDEMNFEYGRLQLEQSTWAEPNRIETVARGQFDMSLPGPTATVVIKASTP